MEEKLISKIEIITRPSKLEELKIALNDIGVTGMTITSVLGSGMQKGSVEVYRGQKLEVNLLQKVKIEIVVCELPVDKVIETAKKVLYTGKVGDGKIFVSEIKRAVKVRTGEEGWDALQDK